MLAAENGGDEIYDQMTTSLHAIEYANPIAPSNSSDALDTSYESLVRTLASQTAVAIRNSQLEELSFKDALTDVYNRRYLRLRLDEEIRRHLRFEQPMSS